MDINKIAPLPWIYTFEYDNSDGERIFAIRSATQSKSQGCEEECGIEIARTKNEKIARFIVETANGTIVPSTGS